MPLKKRLGEMLIEAGVIDETQLHAALGHQRKWGGKLGQALIDLKLATEPQIVAALSRKFGYGAVNVSTLPRTPQIEAALKLIPREIAMRQTLLPVASDSSSVTVAMADPSNIAVVDELSFRTGRRIKIVLAGDREIASAVRRLYYADEEPSTVVPIPLEEISGETPFETTSDPFAAPTPAPNYPRDGRLDGPPGAPQRLSQREPAVVPPPPLPRAAGLPPARVNAPTPPSPVLQRGAAPPVRTTPDPPPGFSTSPQVNSSREPLAPLATPPADLLGEPILATELAPAEEASELVAPESQLTPRQAAMLDALERAARGEESGLLRPGHLAAVLLRLLVKRGIVSQRELLEELTRK